MDKDMVFIFYSFVYLIALCKYCFRREHLLVLFLLRLHPELFQPTFWDSLYLLAQFSFHMNQDKSGKAHGIKIHPNEKKKLEFYLENLEEH